MQKQQCSWTLCSGQEQIVDEWIKQKNVAIYHKKLAYSSRDNLNTWRKDGVAKPVFSFKLNCFRNYNDSDKKKGIEGLKRPQRQHAIRGIQYCKSFSTLSLKSSPQKFMQKNRIKTFVSPPPRNHIPSTCQQMEKLVIEYQHGIKSANQNQGRPQIAYLTSRIDRLNEEKIVQNKNLAETQYSSKTSQIRSRLREPSQTLKFSFAYETHSRKTSSENRIALDVKNCKFTESLHASTFIPSFKNVVQAEPKKIFPNLNTVKTILTSSHQQRECSEVEKSYQKSKKSFDAQQEQDSMMDLGQQSSNNFKKVVRNKRKTAYFGHVQESSTQKSIIVNNISNFPFQQFTINQDGNKNNAQKAGRKVQFIIQPGMKQSFFRNQTSKDCKENESSRKYQKKAVHESSLHNIIESVHRQNKSIDNSIKEIKLVSGSTQENGKFKYVNTIKSIGGESALSQNSYIDIKFMQNLKQKRGIVKLV